MKISISIISHNQIDLVQLLLNDFKKHCDTSTFEVILTLNCYEELPFSLEQFSFLIKLIKNEKAKGFGENHNQAFSCASGDFFCVVNPDIRLKENPFPILLSYLENNDIGVVAPLVINESGNIEDSARYFPTPFIILCRVFGLRKIDYLIDKEEIFPDWIAGMFMLFKSATYNRLNGFNHRFFMYYEDVDLCARLHLNGYKVLLSPKIKIIHNARRSSHRNFKYFKWHFFSMLTFFLSSTFVKVLWKKYR